MITENGVADEADLIRPSYMVEHLLALHAAIKSGVDVAGTPAAPLLLCFDAGAGSTLKHVLNFLRFSPSTH